MDPTDRPGQAERRLACVQGAPLSPRQPPGDQAGATDLHRHECRRHCGHHREYGRDRRDQAARRLQPPKQDEPNQRVENQPGQLDADIDDERGGGESAVTPAIVSARAPSIMPPSCDSGSACEAESRIRRPQTKCHGGVSDRPRTSSHQAIPVAIQPKLEGDDRGNPASQGCRRRGRSTWCRTPRTAPAIAKPTTNPTTVGFHEADPAIRNTAAARPAGAPRPLEAMRQPDGAPHIQPARRHGDARLRHRVSGSISNRHVPRESAVPRVPGRVRKRRSDRNSGRNRRAASRRSSGGCAGCRVAERQVEMAVQSRDRAERVRHQRRYRTWKIPPGPGELPGSLASISVAAAAAQSSLTCSPTRSRSTRRVNGRRNTSVSRHDDGNTFIGSRCTNTTRASG